MRPLPVLLAGGAVLVTAASVGALVLLRAPAPAHQPPQDPAARAEVERLVRAGSPHQLVALYTSWAHQTDKEAARERILDALLLTPPTSEGLKLALDALASDASPLEDSEPLVDYAAERMAALWAVPDTFKYGRDLMLVQTTERPRVALAASLARHAASLSDQQDPEHQTRSWVTNDLVDVYYQSSPRAQHRITRGLEQLGATDALKVIAGAPIGELSLVKARTHQTETTITDLRARTNDPALRDAKEQLEQLDTLPRPQ